MQAVDRVSGVIAGAALDVLSVEPLPPNHPCIAARQVREVLEGRTPRDAMAPQWG